MKLDRRLKFIEEPMYVIACLIIIIVVSCDLLFNKPVKERKVVIKKPEKITILYKKDKELSIWRYGYYEHLYYTN